MTNETDEDNAANPMPGPGVTAWLSQVVGALKTSQTQTQPYLPAGLGGSAKSGRAIDFQIPDEVVSSDSGTLVRLEIGGLPKGAQISKGHATEEGYWLIEPTQPQNLKVLVPENVSLPFSIMLKGVFSDTEADQTWTELAGYEVSDSSAIPAAEISAVPKASVPAPSEIMPPPMVVIDLDVSVGTDDPDVLKGIKVQFSGLPEGASLNAGAQDSQGTWIVPASELPNLSIVIPTDLDDFDLSVTMNIDGTESQSEIIQVTNDAIRAEPQSAFMIRLAPNDNAWVTRFSVFSDGTATYDRVIQWPQGPDKHVDIWVPYLEDALPFEIVMRHHPFDKTAGGAPKLIGVTIDGDHIRPDSPAISTNGKVDGEGITWQGDLVIDVRRALNKKIAETDQPLETFEAIDVEPEPSIITSVEEDEVDAEDAEDLEFSQGADDSDNLVSADLVEEPMGSEVLAEPEKETPKETSVEPGVLYMDASLEDLQSPHFIQELRRLRDFIRTRPSGNDGEVYARLGIDVTKWIDMRVLGPVGADVELDPLLPTLAPAGGFDNTRTLSPMWLKNVPQNDNLFVRLTGLAPGTLLTHGRNTGNGTWLLSADEAADVALLPPLGTAKTNAVQIALCSETGMASLHASLLIGKKHRIRQYGSTDMQTLSLTLDPAVFDPDGHQALSLTIGDLPPGTLLSGGKNHGGGVWTLETISGASFVMHTATGNKPFTVTITCVALDNESGDSTVVSQGLEIFPAAGAIRLRNNLAA